MQLGAGLRVSASSPATVPGAVLILGLGIGGEEAFMVEHHDDDTVSFTITAFSRPATRLARVAGPLGALVQRRITARYLRSLSKIAIAR